MKHIRTPIADSLGPDPFEVIEGFKKLPTYECSLCGERHTSENLKYAQNHDPSTGEWLDKQLCFDCAKKVDATWDWRVW